MHPTRDLDDIVHQRVRLGILSALHEVDRADFTTLADLLALTSGNLSRNLHVLEEHGYVAIDKTFERRRPRTWVRVTAEGTAALRREVEALRDLLDRVEEPVTRHGGAPTPRHWPPSG